MLSKYYDARKLLGKSDFLLKANKPSKNEIPTPGHRRKDGAVQGGLPT